MTKKLILKIRQLRFAWTNVYVKDAAWKWTAASWALLLLLVGRKHGEVPSWYRHNVRAWSLQRFFIFFMLFQSYLPIAIVTSETWIWRHARAKLFFNLSWCLDPAEAARWGIAGSRPCHCQPLAARARCGTSVTDSMKSIYLDISSCRILKQVDIHIISICISIL